MFFVYILRNPAGHLYTSHTSDITQRLAQHNSGINKSTKNRGPWTLVYQEQFATRSEAMRREKFLKSGRGRVELQRILAHSHSSSAG